MHDLKFALRQLLKHPGFTVACCPAACTPPMVRGISVGISRAAPATSAIATNRDLSAVIAAFRSYTGAPALPITRVRITSGV